MTHDDLTPHIEVQKERERNAGDDKEIAVEQKEFSATKPKEKEEESVGGGRGG